MEVAVFPDVSLQAARAQIDPFADNFITAIKDAVRKYNALDPEALRIFAKWSRAKYNGIWAYIMEEVEMTFPAGEGLDLVKRYGSMEIHIGANMIARIKRMKPNGFTSNYPTARVTDFHTADQGELFPGMWAKPLRVDVGYIEDEMGTRVAKIMVARRLAPDAMDWKYEMTTPPAVQPIPVPATPKVPVPATAQIVGRMPESETPKESQGTDDE